MRRALVAIGLGTLFFVAMITGNRIAFAMVYAAISLSLVGWLWTLIGWRGLRLRRSGVGGVYGVGDAFVEDIEASNQSLLSLAWLEFIDHSEIPGFPAGRAFSLGPRSRTRWRAKGHFELRGRYPLGPAELVTGDPFGFFRRSIRLRSNEVVTVYPRLVDVTGMLPGSVHALGDAVAAGRHADSPPDAYGIRQHNPEDGFSRIQWPSTARLGQPMSKVFEKFEGSELLVLLDLQQSVHRGQGQLSTAEYAVSLAASVAVDLLNQGQPVGLSCNDRRRTHISVDLGYAHLRRILDFLAEAQADGTASLDRLLEGPGAPTRGQHSILVITPSPERAWVDRLVAADRRSGSQSTVFQLLAETFQAPGPAMQARGGVAMSSRHQSFAADRLVWWPFAASDELFRRSAPPSGLVAQPERAI